MSSADRTRHNTFATAVLDRCHEQRVDPTWLAVRQRDPHARYLVRDDAGRAPVRNGQLCWLAATDIAADAPVNFLGQLGDIPVFAPRMPVAHTIAGAAEWLDLRSAAAQLDPSEAGLFAYAQGLANWQDATRHCAYCGAPLTLVEGGRRAACPACGREHFPRTDAAIIVIVEHGDACLLGHQATWRPHQYSTLAGFVEPGESLADAVRREVREETSVEVLDCDFHSSQPWPFPASLMLGFTATAAGRRIELTDGELEDARWFTARDIADGLNDGTLRVSSPVSISYRLIEHWLRTRAGVDLGSLPRAS